MKLVFFGDCMFGRDGHDFVSDPFVHVKHIIKEASCLFFNLETTISVPLLHDDYKEEKKFNYQATDEQLMSLRKITKKTTFVSFANNHTLDYGPKGFENTRNILKTLIKLRADLYQIGDIGFYCSVDMRGDMNRLNHMIGNLLSHWGHRFNPI